VGEYLYRRRVSRGGIRVAYSTFPASLEWIEAR
jgi:hypothetical protein